MERKESGQDDDQTNDNQDEHTQKAYKNEEEARNMQANAAILDLNKFSSINFNLTLSDIDQPWFHRNASRDDAMERLKDQDMGTFLIRPSSHPGCYAMSWVDENNQIRHNLIYNKYPGFTLNVNGNGEDQIYASLTQLVQQSGFLAKYIPNTENISKNLTRSRLERLNDCNFFFLASKSSKIICNLDPRKSSVVYLRRQTIRTIIYI